MEGVVCVVCFVFCVLCCVSCVVCRVSCVVCRVSCGVSCAVWCVGVGEVQSDVVCCSVVLSCVELC